MRRSPAPVQQKRDLRARVLISARNFMFHLRRGGGAIRPAAAEILLLRASSSATRPPAHRAPPAPSFRRVTTAVTAMVSALSISLQAARSDGPSPSDGFDEGRVATRPSPSRSSAPPCSPGSGRTWPSRSCANSPVMNCMNFHAASLLAEANIAISSPPSTEMRRPHRQGWARCRRRRQDTHRRVPRTSTGPRAASWLAPGAKAVGHRDIAALKPVMQPSAPGRRTSRTASTDAGLLM